MDRDRLYRINRAYERVSGMKNFAKRLSVSAVDIKAKFIVGFYDELIERAHRENQFFTSFMVMNAMSRIVEMMGHTYDFVNVIIERINRLKSVAAGCSDSGVKCSKSVGTVMIVMAGNIPLVGFHDFLCSILLGFNVIVKLSSKDSVILPKIYDEICIIYPPLRSRVIFIKDRGDMQMYVGSVDAVLATGSSFSMNGIREMFPDTPMLVRDSRFSFAVLSGKETEEDLQLLVEDMFLYYGLGCRSVSNLFLPKGYDISNLVAVAQSFKSNLTGDCWMNSYKRLKAVLTLDEADFVDGGFFVLNRRDDPWTEMSEIALWYYDSADDIVKFENKYRDNIQKKYTNFGEAQRPKIDEFADNKNTVFFLLKLGL